MDKSHRQIDVQKSPERFDRMNKASKGKIIGEETVPGIALPAHNSQGISSPRKVASTPAAVSSPRREVGSYSPQPTTPVKNSAPSTPTRIATTAAVTSPSKSTPNSTQKTYKSKYPTTPPHDSKFNVASPQRPAASQYADNSAQSGYQSSPRRFTPLNEVSYSAPATVTIASPSKTVANKATSTPTSAKVSTPNSVKVSTPTRGTPTKANGTSSPYTPSKRNPEKMLAQSPGQFVEATIGHTGGFYDAEANILETTSPKPISYASPVPGAYSPAKNPSSPSKNASEKFRDAPSLSPRPRPLSHYDDHKPIF